MRQKEEEDVNKGCVWREGGALRMSATSGDGMAQASLGPTPSFELIRKLWRVGKLFFMGDRKVKARMLLVVVLALCAVCAGRVPTLLHPSHFYLLPL